MRSNQQAQQIIEYLLLFAAVVVIVLYFTSPLGPFRDSVNRVLDQSLNEISFQSEKLNQTIFP